MDWFIEFIKTTDWVDIGTKITQVIVIIIGLIMWFKKNVGNITQMKNDLGELGEITKFFKAILKDNKNLKVELSNLKIEIYELRKDIKNGVYKQ